MLTMFIKGLIIGAVVSAPDLSAFFASNEH